MNVDISHEKTCNYDIHKWTGVSVTVNIIIYFPLYIL